MESKCCLFVCLFVCGGWGVWGFGIVRESFQGVREGSNC